MGIIEGCMLAWREASVYVQTCIHEGEGGEIVNDATAWVGVAIPWLEHNNLD